MLEEEDEAAETENLARARMEGELIATFAELEARFGLDRLDLAYRVSSALMGYVARRQPLDVYVEFCERSGAILLDTARSITTVLEDDLRRRAN